MKLKFEKLTAMFNKNKTNDETIELELSAGEYLLEDGRKIKVDEDGKISLITETPVEKSEELADEKVEKQEELAETEEMPAEETPEETPEEMPVEDRVAALETQYAEVMTALEEVYKVLEISSEELTKKEEEVEKLSKMVEKLSAEPISTPLNIESNKSELSFADKMEERQKRLRSN